MNDNYRKKADRFIWGQGYKDESPILENGDIAISGLQTIRANRDIKFPGANESTSNTHSGRISQGNSYREKVGQDFINETKPMPALEYGKVIIDTEDLLNNNRSSKMNPEVKIMFDTLYDMGIIDKNGNRLK